MIACNQAQQWMDDAIDGELPEDELLSLTEHLAQCETCQTDYLSLINLSQVFKAELNQLQAPKNFESRVLLRLRTVDDAVQSSRVQVAATLLVSLLSIVCAGILISPFGRICWSIINLLALGGRTYAVHFGNWMGSVLPTSTPTIFGVICFAMVLTCMLLVVQIHRRWRTAS